MFSLSSCYTLSRLKGIETFQLGCVLLPLLYLATHFPVWRELKLSVSLNSVSWSAFLLHTFPFEGNWNSGTTGNFGRSSSLLHTFPFEGNWNGMPQSSCQQGLCTLATHFPVWRELKLVKNCLHTDIAVLYLLHTFPFEGNWNIRLWSVPLPRLQHLLHTFPFEGNWNFFQGPAIFTVYDTLATHFPVWREWKRVWPSLLLTYTRPCYTLSRLKGIETRIGTRELMLQEVLLHTFPFEGNWNWVRGGCVANEAPSACYTLSRLKGIETRNSFQNFSRVTLYLATHFPVWRELKLRSLARSPSWHRPLATHFPVWRELKPILRSAQLPTTGSCLLHTFPFEGNWNSLYWYYRTKRTLLATHFPVWRELKRRTSGGACRSIRPCYTLSRLKGIETQWLWLSLRCYWRCLLHTFPFEGNWNQDTQFLRPSHEHLATHFPVWRELKLLFFGLGILKYNLATHFPVWRELKLPLLVMFQYNREVACYTLSRLKGIETQTSACAWSRFHQLATHFPVWRELKHGSLNIKRVSFGLLHTFPFEGNWNGPSRPTFPAILTSLATHFPVWRELKLKLCWAFANVDRILLHTFPFEGNWNATTGKPGAHGISIHLLHTFPFEGNWNRYQRVPFDLTFSLATHFPVWRELKLSVAPARSQRAVGTCYTLSRLKGIETLYA